MRQHPSRVLSERLRKERKAANERDRIERIKSQVSGQVSIQPDQSEHSEHSEHTPCGALDIPMELLPLYGYHADRLSGPTPVVKPVLPVVTPVSNLENIPSEVHRTSENSIEWSKRGEFAPCADALPPQECQEHK